MPTPQGWQLDAADMRELKMMLLHKLTWIVLIAYTLLLVKPVLPIAADKIAHTFWNTQHMLTVHEVNGKFHVHQEMVQGARQTEKEKHAASSKADVQECVQVAVPSMPIVVAYPVWSEKNSAYLCNYTHLFQRINYLPPKSCC